MLEKDIVSSAVPNSPGTPDFEGEYERELASRVLQGVSAIFLLFTASRCPQLDELNSAVCRVRAWMGELHDSVSSADDPCRTQLLPVALALGRAVVEVRRLTFPSTGYDYAARSAMAARCISQSAGLLERISAVRGADTAIPFTCCAADVQHISESRNR